MEPSLYKQITYICCVVCNKIQFGALWYELLLSEWQPHFTEGILMWKCLKKTRAIFVYPGVCTSLHVLPTSVFLCAKMSSCAGHPAYLHLERWVTSLRGLCLLPPPNTGITGCVNMKELYLRLTGGPSVSELIRNRPNKYLKRWWTCDEVGSRNLEKLGGWRDSLRTAVNVAEREPWSALGTQIIKGRPRW